MKKGKLIKRVLILILTIVIFGCSNSNQKHIGEWTCSDNTGETGSLILNKGNSAVFIVGNQVLGGDNFEINGVKATLKYEIDYSKDPIWLDLVIYEEGQKQETVRAKGIIRFLTNNKMEYRFKPEPSVDRFTKFDSEDKENTIVLDKVNEEQPQTETNEQGANEEKTETIPNPEKAEIPQEPEPAPVIIETVSQKNAVRSAKAYLDYSAFSYSGLIEQLEYEQYSQADAVYGADNSGADWFEQAAKSAKAYMEYSAFSRGSLIEQLKYVGYTQAQAEHGADAVGL